MFFVSICYLLFVRMMSLLIPAMTVLINKIGTEIDTAEFHGLRILTRIR